MKELEKKFRKLNIPRWKFEYEMTLRVIKGQRVNTVRCFSRYGRSDFTGAVLQILNELGIDCTVGSNAPRGGKIGTYVEISAANLRKYTIDKIISC